MFTIENIHRGANYRVTGYPDGSDWLMVPARQKGREHGSVGRDHVWVFDEQGSLRIFHAPSRSRCATVRLPKGNRHFGRQVTPSRDGQFLYAVNFEDEERRTLYVVDIGQGAIVAAHDVSPAGFRMPMVERPDGTLLMDICRPRGETGGERGLVLVDPGSGARQDCRMMDRSNGGGFVSASPDGRFWLKADRTTMPVRDISPGILGGIIGRKKERYYGIVVQLWEAFPLRFVRRIVVAWLQCDELPHHAGIVGGKLGSHPVVGHRAIWDAIAETAARVNAGPLDVVPRDAFPRFARDEQAWADIDATWRELTWRIEICGWQPDSAAFWVRTNNFLSCVGIDGKISPRLYTERKGLAGNTGLPCAASWMDILPLQDRKARVSYYREGTALFDGAPSDLVYRWVKIPKTRDHWVPSDNAAINDVHARLRVLSKARKTLTVPLGSWTESDCVAAIASLTSEIDEDFPSRAVDSELRAVFKIGHETFDERHFFKEVREHFPGAAPEICRLIERVVEVNPRRVDLFWNGEEGQGIFCHAVQTLGVLDPSSLPLMRRYGRMMDAEHEYFFARETVPAIIRAHDWTDPVIDFVIWVLLHNFHNSLQDYNEVWSDWGFGAAVAARHADEPDAFARRVLSEIATGDVAEDRSARYGHSAMDQLAQQIPQPHGPWIAAFFAGLERLARTSATAEA